MKIFWKAPALFDLVDIREFIDKDNPSAAKRVAINIKESANKLAINPFIGRIGTLDGTRELVVTKLPYILVYQVDQDQIEILRVVHTSKLWSEDN